MLPTVGAALDAATPFPGSESACIAAPNGARIPMGDGIILNLLPRTDFDFSKVTQNTTMTLWLAQNIDASAYREGILAARLHAATLAGSSGPPDVNVILFPVAPTEEDPAPGQGGGFFRDAAKLTLQVFNTGTPTVPSLKTAPISGVFWGLMSLQLSVRQWVTSPTSTIFTLSVDLNLKR